MILLVHSVQRALRVHGEPVELAGETYREIADVYHFLYLAETLLL